MNKIFSKCILLLSSVLLINVAHAEANSIKNEELAKKLTECGASTLRTGLIKTAFNQQTDRESRIMVTAGLVLITYSRWLTSPEYAKNLYIEEDQKLRRAFSKYNAHNKSRSDIYNYTVNYLVPKNEKCAPILIKFAQDKDFVDYVKTDEAKKFQDEIMESASKNL